MILLPLRGPWVGAGSAGALNLPTPTGFRVEVGENTTHLFGRMSEEDLVAFSGAYVHLSCMTWFESRGNWGRNLLIETGLWVWNHTSPGMPQASMLGWTAEASSVLIISFARGSLVSCKWFVYQAVPLSFPNTQTAQKIGSRLKVGPAAPWHQREKSPLFVCFVYKNRVLTSQSTSFALQRILSGLLKQGPQLGYLKHKSIYLSFCFVHNMLGPAYWGSEVIHSSTDFLNREADPVVVVAWFGVWKWKWERAAEWFHF